jgi:hypothetical protein
VWELPDVPPEWWGPVPMQMWRGLKAGSTSLPFGWTPERTLGFLSRLEPGDSTAMILPSHPAKSPAGKPLGFNWQLPKGGDIKVFEGSTYRDTPTYRRLLAKQRGG